MTLHATPIAILSDNYAWLLRCDRSGALSIVDPAEEAPVAAAIDRAVADGGRLESILITHHHDDHIAAVDAIRARFGARVIGAAADRHRLPALERAVAPGDTLRVGEAEGEVIDTPGHTLGHLSYYFPDGGVLLCADTLFSLGCGRLLEGTPADMFASLRRLAALPDDTLVCCGHEYTASNARFARSEHDGPALAARADEIDRQREAGEPTVPTRLGEEKRLNPFLTAPDVDALARLRRAKDQFR